MICSASGSGWACDREAVAHGLCSGHYMQVRRGVGPKPVRPYGRTTARDDAGRKQCGICGDWQPESAFYGDARRVDGLTSRCRNCISVRKHGMARASFLALLESQDGQCAICGREEPGWHGSWHIDHDHTCCPGERSCGKCIRGILCPNCNIALGHMRDDVQVIEQALRYLIAWKEGR